MKNFFSRKKPLSQKAKNKMAFWLDVTIRVVLGAWFAFSAGGYLTTTFKMLKRASDTQSTFMLATDVFTILSIAFFAFFIACLYAIRLKPVSKFAGLMPALAAVLGAFLMYGLLWLKPRMDLPIGIKLTADFLILGGNFISIYALRHLGRSFSILPEGRSLVMTGPYRYIRHPVYLGEAFSTIGAMLSFLSPAALALVAVQFAMQLARIHYEEKVLRETFPDYAKYSRKTERLIPGLY
jgi:protein-S-isoprenylcysteine O-methyltransferase Ste14